MHHSAGCFSDQHHRLWGVCPSHSSASLLSPRVHLQLRNRRSKVPLCTFTFLVARIIRVKSAVVDTACGTFRCSITYNGSMESPIPLYPTDCPPPYEAVMGQRAPSQVSVYFVWTWTRAYLHALTFFSTITKATMFDPHGTELSGERGTSTAFSGEGERS